MKKNNTNLKHCLFIEKDKFVLSDRYFIIEGENTSSVDEIKTMLLNDDKPKVTSLGGKIYKCDKAHMRPVSSLTAADIIIYKYPTSSDTSYKVDLKYKEDGVIKTLYTKTTVGDLLRIFNAATFSDTPYNIISAFIEEAAVKSGCFDKLKELDVKDDVYICVFDEYDGYNNQSAISKIRKMAEIVNDVNLAVLIDAGKTVSAKDIIKFTGFDISLHNSKTFCRCTEISNTAYVTDAEIKDDKKLIEVNKFYDAVAAVNDYVIIDDKMFEEISEAIDENNMEFYLKLMMNSNWKESKPYLLALISKNIRDIKDSGIVQRVDYKLMMDYFGFSEYAVSNLTETLWRGYGFDIDEFKKHITAPIAKAMISDAVYYNACTEEISEFLLGFIK